MQVSVLTSLDTLSATQWNALGGVRDNPFLRHEFLAGLETCGCVGDHWGWSPRHLALHQGERLIGAVPMYRKTHSYGELVFDHAWADAYRRAGLAYYPKLVVGVPYSPVTGPRLLLAEGIDRPRAAGRLIAHARELAEQEGLSSLHWLFPDEADLALLTEHRMLPRLATQFHWHNHNYRDFDAYLQQFSAVKRKKIKRERRRVSEQGIHIEVLDGHQINDAQWHVFHRFYRDTFDRRGGYPTLNEAFFRHLGRTLPQSVLLMLASHQGDYVAGALSLRSEDTLYGRHWGCNSDFHSLHFELCYYQGLEYCIRHGLQRFEPGAQGEHKVARGFEPTPVWSAHWLAHPAFSRAVADYLIHEQEMVQRYIKELREHLPFKSQEH
jgi:uncharacterized protein